MAQRVVLHVGAMKSGTSYLQSLLFHNKDTLKRQGVLVPGDRWGHQVHAVKQILGPGPQRPRWSALVEEVRSAEGAAVISMEFLGPVGPRVAGRVVRSLAPAEVHVVLTARDVNRSLVSLWQETVQNGRSWTWQDYLADARDKRPREGDGVRDRTTPGGTFWRQQHVARMWGTWAGVVGAEHCTLVTLPGPGASTDLLAKRFGEAAGLTFEDLHAPGSGNPSLGLTSVLVLRRLNELLEERGLTSSTGRQLRKGWLAKQVLATRRRQEPTLGLPVADWVRDQADATVRRLQANQVPVVGEWADLQPVAVPGVDPAEVPDAEIAEAALFALAELLAERVRG